MDLPTRDYLPGVARERFFEAVENAFARARRLPNPVAESPEWAFEKGK